MHVEAIRLQTDLEQAHAEDKVAALHAQARELGQDAERQRKQLQKSLDIANAEVRSRQSIPFNVPPRKCSEPGPLSARRWPR